MQILLQISQQLGSFWVNSGLMNSTFVPADLRRALVKSYAACFRRIFSSSFRTDIRYLKEKYAHTLYIFREFADSLPQTIETDNALFRMKDEILERALFSDLPPSFVAGTIVYTLRDVDNLSTVTNDGM